MVYTCRHLKSNPTCLCGKFVSQSPQRCAQCGAALCEACAARRDRNGLGPLCCQRQPPNPTRRFAAALVAALAGRRAVAQTGPSRAGRLAAELPRVLDPRRDIFRAASLQQYTLTGVPSLRSSTLVFVNGLLSASDADYTISGAQLTFTGQTIAPNSTIQVTYSTERML
jgi:hypothetical protein